MLQRAGSSSYSWWWASHIRTRQSKWLEQNLQDMEMKVKSMLKLIEEDADSFAKRAEMFYKKRPELVNLVEEFYRAYRALAERCDHISGELHSANSTIATVFPEQFAMAEPDSLSNPSPSNKTPQSKPPPGRLDPKIEHESPQILEDFAARKATLLSLDPIEAQKEVDRLRRQALTLQTEKEFLKSSYENCLAKYWDVEKKFQEIQADICCLTEEFELSPSFGEEEAQALMAAAALKACEDTLVQLKEQQAKALQEAHVEDSRIKELEEKINFLLGNGVILKPENENSFDRGSEKKSEEDGNGVKPEDPEFKIASPKSTENFPESSDSSLMAPELGQKIDGLVHRVIILETQVSSQSAQIKLMKSENDELQRNLQSFQENKMEDEKERDEMVKGIAAKLNEIRNLNSRVEEQGNHLKKQLALSCRDLNGLAIKLESLRSPDETENLGSFGFGGDGIEVEHQEQIREDAEVEKETVLLEERGILDVEVERQKILTNQRSLSNGEEEREKTLHKQKNLMGEEDFDQWMQNQEKLMDEDREKRLQNQKVSVEEVEEREKTLQDQKDSKQGEEERERALQNQNNSTDLEDEREMTMKIQLSSMDGDEERKRALQNQSNSTDLEDEREMTMKIQLSSMDGDEERKRTLQNQNNSKDLEEEREMTIKIQLSSMDGDEEKERALQNQQNSMEGEKECVLQKKQSSLDLGEENENTSGYQERGKAQEPDIDSDDCPNWQHLFLEGLEGREKILLTEYTSILRNYKETKKKLSLSEKQYHDALFETATQRGLLANLESENAYKDELINSLRQQLREKEIETQNSETQLKNDAEKPAKDFEFTGFKGMEIPTVGSFRSLVTYSFREKPISAISTEDDVKVVFMDEPKPALDMEEKFRRDIDILLEENLEFWLRFSTSFHQIQKFQTTSQDLQAELLKLKSHNKKYEGSTTSDQSIKAEAIRIETQFKALQAELSEWLEHHNELKKELQCRFTSLCKIEEELTNTAKSSKQGESIEDRENRGTERESGVEEREFTAYQAEKFRGEVLNMQQENNKVADELQAGLDHVQGLKFEVEKALSWLQVEHGLSQRHSGRHSHGRMRTPLRSFIFGVKPKKPSIFSCMNPALQKQFSDLRAGVHM
ncbi:hypothetical protein AMTRI_Chr13g124100 [Amborella trichopoda]